MSAKDELDRFDREWAVHKRQRGNATRTAGYNELLIPDSLRDEFKRGLEALIVREVLILHSNRRRQLVKAALREARQTIAELDHGPIPESPPEEPKQFPEWPEGAEEKEA